MTEQRCFSQHCCYVTLLIRHVTNIHEDQFTLCFWWCLTCPVIHSKMLDVFIKEFGKIRYFTTNKWKKKVGTLQFCLYFKFRHCRALAKVYCAHHYQGLNHLFPGGKGLHVVVILLQLRIDWFGTSYSFIKTYASQHLLIN